MKMKNKIFSTIVPLALGLLLACTGCGSNEVDYTKAPAQTGGPEQGMWQNKQGTMLTMNSGTFEYKKEGGGPIKGTYKVDGTKIDLSSDMGSSYTANFPDPNGPLTIDGQQLVKTD